MATVKITDDSFDSDVLKAEGPVLVDYWPSGAGRANRSARRSKKSPASWPARSRSPN